MKNTMMQTYSGKLVDVMSPSEEDVSIKDIAHALSLINRYNGHTDFAYSVAEHCVIVSRNCDDPLAGLLHDASEAYIGDITAPVKASIGESIGFIEDSWHNAIEEQFFLSSCSLTSQAVKEADRYVLGSEVCYMLGQQPVNDWHLSFLDGRDPLPESTFRYLTPEDAEEEFLSRYYEITGHTPWVDSDIAKAFVAAMKTDGHRPEDEEECILDEAARITRGDRQANYGPPDQDFSRTAAMWTALFKHKMKDGEAFEATEVASAMIALKLSRHSHQRKRDNPVDIAGYARCMHICDKVAESRKNNMPSPITESVFDENT